MLVKCEGTHPVRRLGYAAAMNSPQIHSLFLAAVLTSIGGVLAPTPDVLAKPRIGVAWPRKGPQDAALVEATQRLLRGKPEIREVVDLGEWTRGTLRKAQAAQVGLVAKITALEAKQLRKERRPYSDGRQLEFYGAEVEIEVEGIDVQKSGEVLTRWVKSRRTYPPGFHPFPAGEKKAELRSDPRELLREELPFGVMEVVRRVEARQLWEQRGELAAKLGTAAQEDRVAFWDRAASLLSRPLNISWPCPRASLLEAMRAEFGGLQARWRAAGGELRPADTCEWCGAEAGDDLCLDARHLRALRSALSAVRVSVLSRQLPAKLAARAERARSEGETLGLHPSEIDEDLERIDLVLEIDAALLEEQIAGRGRRSTATGLQFLVIRRESPWADLRLLDSDLREAANYLTYFPPPEGELPRAWKIRRRGDFIALMEREKPGRGVSDARAVEVVTKDLTVQRLETLLLKALHTNCDL